MLWLMVVLEVLCSQTSLCSGKVTQPGLDPEDVASVKLGHQLSSPSSCTVQVDEFHRGGNQAV